MPPTNLFGLGYGVGPAGYGYPSVGRWSPLSLGSSLGWWNANDSSTTWQNVAKSTPASASTDPVRVIADKSGGGYDLVFPSDPLRGSLRLDVANGRSTVRLNGTDQYAEATVPRYTGSTLTVCGLVYSYNGAAGIYGGIVAVRDSVSGHDTNAEVPTAMPAIAYGELPSGFRNSAVLSSGPGLISYVPRVAASFVSVFDGANHKMYIDGKVATQAASSGAFSFDRVMAGAWWFAGAPGYFGNIDIMETFVVGAAVNAADVPRIDAYLHRDATINAKQAVFCGDSITQGLNLATGSDYPAQMIQLLGSTWCGRNLGVPSQTTTAMTTNAATRVDYRYDANRAKNVCLVWSGINDAAAGDSGATIWNNVKAYCADRRSAGFQVLVFTLLPAGADANVETRRSDFNTLARANWATFADGLVDVAADSRIGDAGDQNNATYYQDTVHLTTAGCAIVAGIAKTAVEALP